jgi:hypothetical protein
MAVQNDPAKAGEKALADNALAHPEVDPKAIPADTGRPGHPDARPDAGGNPLLAAAQAKAPSLTAELVKNYKLTDEDLAAIARGEVPPPPYNGPDFSGTDLHRTPGGWQVTHAGQKPEDVGQHAIGR